MYIKTYIIRTHTREMKTVLVLSRAKCNKNIDYASATWVPSTEHSVLIHHVQEIGFLFPITAVLHAGSVSAGSDCFPDHSFWAESIPD